MKIVQITDLHVGRLDEDTFGVDVRNNFIDILHAAQQLNPDKIVFTGDFCFRSPHQKIYKWIQSQLSELNIPYEIIGGNHDNIPEMAGVFDLQHLLQEDEIFFSRRWEKAHVLFLDSAKGFHSEQQLNWLKRHIRQSEGMLLIFMHHPPIKAGVAYMDGNHTLKDMDKLQEILFAYPDNVHIFCGHYHVEKTLRLKNLVVEITPSCYFQLEQNSMEFKVDHHNIALREIDLSNDFICSTVRYYPGNKF